ncbi:hypothetical protein [Caballeronia sp. GAFFF2]|uniref:hypothetical protein n=1 Tax=Caballeronia sp. GAFFF2 TaxID=2921741 RepID=UPI002028B3B5|nr:hypothetical protein [Caballeronia sp. GAFFF2]
MRTLLALILTAIAVGLVMAVIRQKPGIFYDCEQRIERWAQTRIEEIKEWLGIEITTLSFAGAIIAVGVVLVIGLSFVSESSALKTVSTVLEYGVAILNFAGVMFISRGVILMNEQREKLKKTADAGDSSRFTQVAADLFVDASTACERGSLLVAAAFLLDLIAKTIG